MHPLSTIRVDFTVGDYGNKVALSPRRKIIDKPYNFIVVTDSDCVFRKIENNLLFEKWERYFRLR